jgi:hypothetical protein
MQNANRGTNNDEWQNRSIYNADNMQAADGK